jgi:signal transduction histidine kinase
VPFILISGVLSEEIAVEMMKRGAADYLLKDRLSRLGVAVQNALDERRMRAAAEDERAKAQHLLAELDRERALNEQRNRLVQFATHELKNPLTSIRSSAETLLRYYENMPEDRRIQHLGVIFSSTSRLLEMINDLLTLGRLDEGISAMTPIRLDLDVLVLSIVDQFRHTFPEQPIYCQVIPDDYQIQGDTRLLRQIIENLLGNAVRYSPEHRPITIRLQREADRLALQVQDGGIGIQPEELMNLFQPFRRGTNTSDIPGTGLGLAIVKQSVELHNGRITVESTPGVGTTFTVSLPSVED